MKHGLSRKILFLWFYGQWLLMIIVDIFMEFKLMGFFKYNSYFRVLILSTILLLFIYTIYFILLYYVFCKNILSCLLTEMRNLICFRYFSLFQVLFKFGVAVLLYFSNWRFWRGGHPIYTIKTYRFLFVDVVFI